MIYSNVIYENMKSSIGFRSIIWDSREKRIVELQIFWAVIGQLFPVLAVFYIFLEKCVSSMRSLWCLKWDTSLSPKPHPLFLSFYSETWGTIVLYFICRQKAVIVSMYRRKLKWQLLLLLSRQKGTIPLGIRWVEQSAFFAQKSSEAIFSLHLLPLMI